MNVINKISAYLFKSSLIITLSLLTYANTVYSQHSWTGGTGDWNNAANWSPATIPTANDNVTLAGAADIVTVPAGYNAVAKQMIITNSASLTVSATATLLITGSSDDGIRMATTVTLTNHGTITIDNIAKNALEINSSTTVFENSATGTVFINNSGLTSAAADAIKLNGIINNSGLFFLGPDIPEDGINMGNNGTLNNLNGGQFNILGVGTGQDGIEDGGDNQTINNSGTLCIEEANVDGNNIAPGITFNNTGTFNTSGCNAVQIPTMGEWSLIIFGLIVLSIGMVYVMRWKQLQARRVSLNLYLQNK